MTKEKIWKAVRLLPSVILLSLLVLFSLENNSRVMDLARKNTIATVTYFTQELEGWLGDGFSRKYDFIELNGAMTRTLGIRTLNDRQKLESGALASFPYLTMNNENLPAKIAQLQEFVEDQGAGFLCLTMPLKEESYAGIPSPGYNGGQRTMEQFCAGMAQQEVNFLNMEDWFRQNGWGLLDIYFKTDHHWRPEAAFAAVQQIMQWYADNQNLTLDPQTLDLGNWNVEVYEDWFLGSEGKRTGAAYAGVDDFSLITPKFETEYTVGRLRKGRSLVLDNPHSVYDMSHLEKKDWYNLNPHGVYMGGDYPYIYVENPKAVNDQTLVLVGDSYRMEAEAFLATQFTRMYHIDMRYYEDGTLTEFLAQVQPDQVLLLFVSPQDGPKNLFGLEQWQQNWAGKVPGEPVLVLPQLALPEAAGEQDFYLLQANLAPGVYELTLDQASVTRTGDTDGGIFQQIALVDLSTGQIRSARYFLYDQAQPQSWRFTVPQEDTNFAIYVYNGMCGYTKGNTTTLEGITLRPYR